MGDCNLDDDYRLLKPPLAAQSYRLPFDESLLPSIIRVNVQSAPPNRKLPVLIASLAPLCAIACRVRMHYPYDRGLHALLLQVIIEGSPGIGKSFASYIVNQIIGPTLEAMDEQQRREEQEYRERKNSRAQNEKIGKPPMTTIRCIPASTSHTTILRRADLFKRLLDDVLTFFMWSDELATITDASRSAYSNLRTILRIAYDLGSKYGQDFASDNSYSAIADILICSMFCATPQDVDDYMDRRAVMGGNCNRLILCHLEDEPGARPAIFAPLTDQQQQIIDRTLTQMMDDCYDAEGRLQPLMVLDMSWLDAEVNGWCNAKGDEVIRLRDTGATGWKALDTFRKRASVNAFRCTTLFYYLYRLENIHSEEAIRDLCSQMYRFLADFNLDSLMGRWGAAYETYLRNRVSSSANGVPKAGYVRSARIFSRN